MKPTPAICFAADVKKSRQMEKGRLLSILNEYQQTINRRFHQDLLVPFTIRNGDELIGVIGNFASAYPLIDYILQQSHLHRCPFYLGIGIGKLETTNITDVHAINGSAVLYAFEARDQHLKEKNDKIKIWNEAEAETSFCILSESVPSEPLNTLLGFILSTKRKWTSKQQQVIHLIEQFPEWTYEKIGNHLGYKSPISTVSYLLKRADYQKVKAAEASFTQLLLLYEKLLK
jgi:SatD family (SatD)